MQKVRNLISVFSIEKYVQPAPLAMIGYLEILFNLVAAKNLF